MTDNRAGAQKMNLESRRPRGGAFETWGLSGIHKYVIIIPDMKNQEEKLLKQLKSLHEKMVELLEVHVRPISHQLYPSILRRGLVVAIQSLADQFETALDIEMDLDEVILRRERSDPRFIPEQVRLTAYRIAEEALTT